MKIVQITQSLVSGGAERLVVDLSNTLAANVNDKVYILSLKNRLQKRETFYVDELSPQVEYIPMNFEDGPKLNYLLKLSNKIKKLRPDIVHIHCKIHYLLLAFILNRKCRFVYTLHSRADRYFDGIRKIIVQQFSKSKRFQIVTISDSNSHSLHLFTEITNDIIIYNGRAFPLHSIEFEQRKEQINNLKHTTNDTVLLTIANCSKLKNIQLLIRSVNGLVTRGQNITLLIIGDNYKNTKLGEELVSLAGTTIHFLGEQYNVGDYFRLADAYCLSSTVEGMPITLLEAFACGCVPISTPVSGAVDIIKDGETGFISPDFTETNYTRTIERFLKNKNRISKEMLIEEYYRKFSIEKCTSEYYSLYKELTHERS